jgi:predicted nucleic acid-binding protein
VTAFVIDASVTIAWCFRDESTDRTDALYRRACAEGIAVPDHWSVEVANVLVVAERRNRTTPELTVGLLRLLDPVPVERDAATVPRRTLVDLARSYRLTAYDAAYLELAIRRALPLATLDDDLRRASATAGVPLL